MLTFGSLFSGIGAFDLAFERMGWKPLWACEIDPDCRRVLKRHWPDVTIYEDVRAIDGATTPVPDIIIGGFPCQDLSLAGRRQGLAGERSGLWWEFRRVLAVVAPRWCLIENVPGLLSSWSPVEPAPEPVEGGQWEVEEASDLETVLASLGELGYGWAYTVLDAQYRGLAQRRERVFIVGRAGDAGGLSDKASRRNSRRLRSLPARVLFEPESLPGDSPPRREAGKKSARGVASGAGATGFDKYNQQVTGEVGCTLGAGSKEHNNAHVPHVVQETAPCLRTNAYNNSDPTMEAQMLVFQATGAGSERTGSPSLARSDDNGSNQIVVAPLMGHHPRDTTDGHVVVGPLVTGRTPKGHGMAGVNSQAVASGHIIAFHATQDPISGEVSPANGRGNEQGCGSIAVAYTLHGTPASNVASETDCAAAQSSRTPGQYENSTTNVIAFQERGCDGGRRLDQSEELAYSLTAPAGGGRSQERNIQAGTTLRRLTPTECLRLQGLPDDHLDVDPPLSDSTKYRMVGNSGAVPVLELIARRIKEAEGDVS